MGDTDCCGKNPTKLKQATVKRITGKECMKKWKPKKARRLPEKEWKLLQKALSTDKGFCVRGNNKGSVALLGHNYKMLALLKVKWEIH